MDLRKTTFRLTLFLLFLNLPACEKKVAPATAHPLDVTLKGQPKGELVSDQLLPMTYTIEVGSGFESPDCDLTLFVHFIDDDGKKVFQDDHPVEPASHGWKPGQAYSDTRLLALPLLEKETKARVLAGLYCPAAPHQPYALNGKPWREGEYRYELYNGTIQPFIKPISDELVGYDGWYAEEYDIPNRLSWRWMGSEAKLILANSGKDSILYLRGRQQPNVFQRPTTLLLMLNDKPLGQVRTDSNGRLEALFHLDRQSLGENTLAIVDLAVDQTFVPKDSGLGEDVRTLGLMMTQVHYGPETQATRKLEPFPHQGEYMRLPGEEIDDSAGDGGSPDSDDTASEPVDSDENAPETPTDSSDSEMEPADSGATRLETEPSDPGTSEDEAVPPDSGSEDEAVPPDSEDTDSPEPTR